MIFTIVGKPGGGKSFYSLRHIVNVLAHTENSVVTNLSVNVAELHAYLSQKYPDKAIDTPRRVRILNVDQSRRFWLYRIDANGLDVDLGGVTREEEKQGRHVDYSKITDANREALAKGFPRLYPGIDYIIDECHVFFDARSWTETGLSLTYYNSQHRKLDDNVTFVTQFLELIDKRVKSFSQEFIYLRNNGAEKIFTLFRGPAYFTAKHYQRPPSGLQDMPSEVHRFALDLALAKCYDTSAGVGISGVGRPEAKRKKGLHVAWLVVPFVAFMAVLFWAPDWLAGTVLGTKVGDYSARTLGLKEGASAASVAPSAVPAAVRSSSPPPLASSLPAVVGSDPAAVYPVGYVKRGNRVNVSMSDGTTRTERDRELTRVERNSITLDGQKLFFRPLPPRLQVAPSPAVDASVLATPPDLQASPPHPPSSQSAAEVPGKSTYRL